MSLLGAADQMQYNHTMSDEYQIEIPPSFMALYTDRRHRLTTSVAHLRARYDVCEDLANHLTDHCRHIHVDIGVDEQDVLHRCLSGLQTPDSGVSDAEAIWIVTRLAELLAWPAPDFSPPSEEGLQP